MSFTQLRNIHQRLVVSFLMTAFMLVAIYYSNTFYLRPLFALFIAAVAGIAFWEFEQLVKSKGYHTSLRIGWIGCALYIFAAFLSSHFYEAELFPEIAVGITFAMLFAYYCIAGENPLLGIPLTVFGLLYLVVPLGCLIQINYYFANNDTQDGRWWLLYLLCMTKLTDTGAYFVGKKFGKTPLAPYISPKKTWEGAMGGVLTALAASVLFCLFLHQFSKPPMQLSCAQSMVLGVVLSVFAQFGDLAESLLKRDAKVKDSNQLPGLGGVLDIVDSIIFTAPLLYILLKLHY